MPIAEKNKKGMDAMDTYAEVATYVLSRMHLPPPANPMLTCFLRANAGFDLFDDDLRDDEKRLNASFAEASDFIVDIREYDVPYHVRVMIDMGTVASRSCVSPRLTMA